MSAAGMLALVVTAATTADDIRGVAGLASLTLALIGYFTNLRYSAFGEAQKRIGPFGRRTLAEAAPDALLLLVALVALVAMAPLLGAFEPDRIGRRAGALPTLFALVWLGFVVIAAFELRLIVVRIRKALGVRALLRQRQRPAASGPAATGDRAP